MRKYNGVYKSNRATGKGKDVSTLVGKYRVVMEIDQPMKEYVPK